MVFKRLPFRVLAIAVLSLTAAVTVRAQEWPANLPQDAVAGPTFPIPEPATPAAPAEAFNWPSPPLPGEPVIAPELAPPPPPATDRRRDLSPMGGGPGDRAPFKTRLWWIPSQNVTNQPGDLTMNGQELELAFPIHRQPEGIWLGMASIQRLEIGTDAVYPNSQLAIPDDLWDIEVGTMHLRELADGWKAGGMLRVGSPSDQPFEALRDITVSLLAFVTIPANERDAWNLSLFYSPTGQIIFPVPGIAYQWNPNDTFRANIGIPFSLEYRPYETTSINMSYMPLTNFKVMVRQGLGPGWTAYGGYETVNETFLLADRANTKDRTYFFDQRLLLGLRRELAWRWSVDLSAAYVFDRQIFQAEKFTGDRTDELLIAPGFAGTLQLQWTR